MLFEHFGYRLADIAVRHLDMQQRREGGGDIRHVYFPVGYAVPDAPAHEEQGNMRILRIPDSMRSSLIAALEPAWFGDHQDRAAAFAVVAVDDHFLQGLGQESPIYRRHIADI